jgi:ethanolamine utilization protein EutA (predicted chaperonin)
MQDNINTDKFPYKVNAVTLMEYNEELRDLCLETGGKLIQVDQSERVYAHSKEAGQQEITKK